MKKFLVFPFLLGILFSSWAQLENEELHECHSSIGSIRHIVLLRPILRVDEARSLFRLPCCRLLGCWGLKIGYHLIALPYTIPNESLLAS